MPLLAINIDLITGWFPLTVAIVATGSVILSVGWHDGAWKWQLPVGVPISFFLTVLTGVAIMGWAGWFAAGQDDPEPWRR